MRAGANRELITITRQVQTPDGHGGSTSTSSIYWGTWADVTPMKASRTLEAANMVLNAAWEFKVRYRADKTPTKSMWVEYKGEKLQISSITQDKLNRRDYIIIANARD